ncbi:unnamed protein product [Protopolystoma xenopodis]|uniref:Uncharacterized protein n=1 Tax=Protopolystoma xenopodis TaxID=117903 RepID=A0A3S5AGC5_9PLAT|nr:unnamed protein product [Protopolystoma xenopodis]
MDWTHAYAGQLVLKPEICDITADQSNSSMSLGPENEQKVKLSKKELDRLTGLTEEEVKDKQLPDYLKDGLDMVIVRTCLYQSELVPLEVTCYDDSKMVDYGIGFTNVCTRPTKGAADLTRKEMKAGAAIMLEKMRRYKPRIAVFNGKGII